METQDTFTDVQGVSVGHAQRTTDGWLTGTTVVLTPEGGAVAAVDVRGGGPGTRETDSLDPRNLVGRADAVVLAGGSAFGLDTAAGVMARLEEEGRGVRVGPEPTQVVPVVPAAVLFDLGRGGRWSARPGAALGREAVEAAFRSSPGAWVPQGCVGAGTGAVVGGMKGGIGTASAVLETGVTVGVLAVVNAAGSPVEPESGALYGELFEGRPRFPEKSVHTTARARLAAAREETSKRAAGSLRRQLNTTLAVVATDADLTRPQAQKLAGTAHDGLARAIRPAHLMNDGDTVFALATGRQPLVGGMNSLLAAGADVLTRAVVRAVLSAESVDGAGGVFPSYSDLYGRPRLRPRAT